MSAQRGFAPGRHKIEDYGGGGFRFAGMSHRGSILALASGVRALDAVAVVGIDAALIDEIIVEAKTVGLDLLLVGGGAGLVPLPAPLRAKLRSAGVACEAMATGTAVRTYNMLVDEDRRVGALLIAI